MFYFKRIINFILRTALVLLFVFSLVAFYFGYSLLSFIISIVITIFFNIVYEIVLKKLRVKNGIKIASQKKFMQVCENLLLLSSKQLEEIFKNLLPKNTFFYFNSKSFDNSDLTSLIKQLNDKKLTDVALCVNNISGDAAIKINNIDNFKIKILDCKDIYSVIEKNNLEIPQVLKLKSKAKFSLKQFGFLFLNRKFIKTYLMLGLFFMFYSILVPFSLYYKICACVALLLAVICSFLPQTYNISGT